MNKCPKCGYEYKDAGRIKGGKTVWRGVGAKERSRRMKAVRRAALERGKA